MELEKFNQGLMLFRLYSIMKNWVRPASLIGLAFLLWGCPPRDNSMPLTEYTPVLMERQALENSIAWLPPRPLGVPAKLYWLPPYLLVSEQYEGVHIFDNSDPANPLPLGFVRVKGCIDMAVSNGFLAVDNAVDLVILDITSQPGAVIVRSRQRDVFPELTPPDRGTIPGIFKKENRAPNTIVVAWEKGAR